MLNDLNPSTRRILEETEDLTKKKFRFQVVEELNTFAKVKAARKTMKEHIILCRRGFDDVLNHIIAHECGHIIRIFRAPESERLVPASGIDHSLRVKEQLSADIEQFSGILDPSSLDQLVKIWHEGIVNQITNQSVDIMIEKWIYSDYPDLRGLQLDSLKKQVAQALTSMGEKARKSAPPVIVDASNLMNYAYLRQLGLFIGENFVKPYSSTRYLDKGKFLSTLLDEVSEDTLAGDIQKINRWVEFLSFDGWFDWIDFERIPPGYEEAV